LEGNIFTSQLLQVMYCWLKPNERGTYLLSWKISCTCMKCVILVRLFRWTVWILMWYLPFWCVWIMHVTFIEQLLRCQIVNNKLTRKMAERNDLKTVERNISCIDVSPCHLNCKRSVEFHSRDRSTFLTYFTTKIDS